MQNILNDLRFALRQLRRAPGFAVTAILTLALGIGANTAIFSLLDQALLRSLPVHDPASLVLLNDSGTAWQGSIGMNGGDSRDYFSYPMYKDLRDQAHAFRSLLCTASTTVGLTRNQAAQFVPAEVVSGNYFQTLGVTAALGRTLQPSDDGAPGANAVAVLSYDFWRDKLGGEASVVGSTVSINGHPFQIVGVSAPRFNSAVWGQTTGIFIPISMINQAEPSGRNSLTVRTLKWLNILGRLQPGETPAQAQAATATLWHALRADELSRLGTRSKTFTRGFLNESQLLVLPGARGFSFNRSSLQNPFLAVMAMALLVLLIASVNVASLLMVRSAGRVREFSLRAALGASSARVVSQLLLEGMLIGASGGLVGLLLAPAAIRVLIGRLGDSDGSTTFSSGIDVRILLFNFAVAIGVSLCFSLVPALQLRRPNLTSTLRESTGTGAGGLLQLRRVVVCLQIGLSVVLLVGAGLFIRTMQRLRAVDVGFNTTHLVTFNIDPSLAGYSMEATPALHERVLQRLAALPGVESVAATDDGELLNNSTNFNITLTGYQAPPEDSYSVENSTVTPGYMATLKIPILAGRALSDTDTLAHPKAALVNEVFLKHFCGGSAASCLGRRIGQGAGDKVVPDTEIVGVVRDSKHRGIREETTATMYRPLKQRPEVTQLYFYVRTAQEPAHAMGEVRATMHQIDPSLAVSNIRTVDQQVDDNLRNERMIELLAISFGVLATLLAGVGLYGVLAYSTAQRTREIGIRMALGSTRLAVSSLILSDVLRLAALGVVLAIPVAYGLSILIRSQLFGVSAADPAILASVIALIALVALLSAVLPARRAATINPTEALRTE